MSRPAAASAHAGLHPPQLGQAACRRTSSGATAGPVTGGAPREGGRVGGGRQRAGRNSSGRSQLAEVVCMAKMCSSRHVPAGTRKRPTRTSRSALRTTSGATLYSRCASCELGLGLGGRARVAREGRRRCAPVSGAGMAGCQALCARARSPAHAAALQACAGAWNPSAGTPRPIGRITCARQARPACGQRGMAHERHCLWIEDQEAHNMSGGGSCRLDQPGPSPLCRHSADDRRQIVHALGMHGR